MGDWQSLLLLLLFFLSGSTAKNSLSKVRKDLRKKFLSFPSHFSCCPNPLFNSIRRNWEEAWGARKSARKRGTRESGEGLYGRRFFSPLQFPPSFCHSFSFIFPLPDYACYAGYLSLRAVKKRTPLGNDCNAGKARSDFKYP